MNYIRTKEGVKFDTIAPGGFRILAALWKAAQVSSMDIVITAATDGVHSGPYDPHYRGQAYDIRTIGLAPDVVEHLQSWLQAELGPDFTVIMETAGPHTTAPHIHVQVKKDVVYG